MTLERRIERLERLTSDAQGPAVMRVVISACGRPLNLAGSTCDRTLGLDGSIVEIVHLDGRRDAISNVELDQFVSRFPLKCPPVCRHQIMAGKSRW
jgi:hypothetical protein